MKITADTLADGDIETLVESLGSPDRDFLTADEQRIASLCRVALIEGSRLGARARERIVEILNARMGSK